MLDPRQAILCRHMLLRWGPSAYAAWSQTRAGVRGVRHPHPSQRTRATSHCPCLCVRLCQETGSPTGVDLAAQGWRSHSYELRHSLSIDFDIASSLEKHAARGRHIGSNRHDCNIRISIALLVGDTLLREPDPSRSGAQVVTLANPVFEASRSPANLEIANVAEEG
jgi:hypothetical protein